MIILGLINILFNTSPLLILFFINNIVKGYLFMYDYEMLINELKKLQVKDGYLELTIIVMVWV